MQNPDGLEPNTKPPEDGPEITECPDCYVDLMGDVCPKCGNDLQDIMNAMAESAEDDRGQAAYEAQQDYEARDDYR